MCNKHCLMHRRNGRNHQVVRANWRTFPGEIRTDLTVFSGSIVIKENRLEIRKQFIQEPKVFFDTSTFQGAEEQFGFHNRTKANC